MRILVANIGSTSFKFQLFEMMPEASLARGQVERIGRAGGNCPDYETAIERCLSEITGPRRPLASLSDLSGVAFKAVHAGPHGGVRRVDETVLRAMEEFAFLAPAHNPPYVAAMRAFARTAPNVPLVAAFETAFFESLDEATTTYAVPYAWRSELGIRRYGFHGASHRWASERAQVMLGRDDLRQISCHLGGSSSVAAIHGGVAVDTSFGLSPQSGLPHNDRGGDLDPFAVLYVMKKRGLGPDEMARVLAGQSGLAGLSGGRGDVRDLLEAARNGDDRATLALEVFVHAVRHYVGAFLVKLGRLDVLSFSGGIGENSPQIRHAVCRGLSSLGIRLEPRRNATAHGDAILSMRGQPVTIIQIHSNEELIVARSAMTHLSRSVCSGAVPTPNSH